MIDIAIIMLAYGSALIITAAMFAVVSKLTTKITKITKKRKGKCAS